MTVQGTSDAIGLGSGGSLTVFGGTAISGSAIIGNGITSDFNCNTLGNIYTTGGNVGIGNTTPNYTLDIFGTANITTSLTTSTLNIAATNLTFSSYGNLFALSGPTRIAIVSSNNNNSINTSNIFQVYMSGKPGSGNQSSLRIESSAGNSYSIASTASGSGTLFPVNISTLTVQTSGNIGINNTEPNFTLDINGTLRITSGGLLATFNSNTLGSLFTTGGNVGINITTPAYQFDVNGTIRCSDIRSTGSRFNLTQDTDSIIQVNIVNSSSGSNSTSVIIRETSGNAMYIGSTSSFSNGYQIFTRNSTGNPYSLNFGVGSNSSGSVNNIMFMSTNGNIGIYNSAPSFTFDVNGTLRITSGGLLATFNSNTLGSLFTTGGNVGINTTAPGNRLDVNGTLRITSGGLLATFNSNTLGSLFTTGGNVGINTTNPTSSLHISGSLAKSSGTFDIQHPILSNKRLVHSFIEGPRCDLIYRGTIQMSQGSALVNIDSDCTFNTIGNMTQGTFEALTSNPVYYLQNNDSFDKVRGNINRNKLSIICENILSNDHINWMVVAERKDIFIKQWERTDTDGFLITEYKN